ncbi:hypothetical protein QQ045_020048 [Rhodiola kirilowii]
MFSLSFNEKCSINRGERCPIRNLKHRFCKTKEMCYALSSRRGVLKHCYTVGPRTYAVELPPSDLGKCLGSRLVLETRNWCDCNFKVGVEPETFNFHKAVLAAHSPIFRALFRKMLNDNPVMVLGIEACVFQAMLHFIYSDSLPEEITCSQYNF